MRARGAKEGKNQLAKSGANPNPLGRPTARSLMRSTSGRLINQNGLASLGASWSARARNLGPIDRLQLQSNLDGRARSSLGAGDCCIMKRQWQVSSRAHVIRQPDARQRQFDTRSRPGNPSPREYLCQLGWANDYRTRASAGQIINSGRLGPAIVGWAAVAAAVSRQMAPRARAPLFDESVRPASLSIRPLD